MVASAALEPLALDVVRDPVSDLGGRLDRYAGALSDRMSDFGGGTDRAGPSLLRSLSDRWSMPGAGAGLIEVFDGTDFGGLVRHWGSRSGYGGDEYVADSPFVIPVDPIQHVEGITGAHLKRRPDPRRALRPVTLRSQRPTPRPRATERWRPLTAPTAETPAAPRFSAYPAAMGQAGAIDATLLRFPTAQAEISDGPDRAVVTDAQASPIPWAPSLSRTPAIRAAEQMSAAVGARLAPAPATDVDAWLVPATATEAENAAVLQMPRARLAQPRVDARVPIAAFESRIGPAALDDQAPAPAAYWDADEAPGVLVEPTRAQPAAGPGLSDGQRVAPREADPSGAPRVDDPRATPGALSARIVERLGAAAPPWQAPTSPSPGRALFVPAALARLALQVGETVRPSATPSAQWPWAEGAPAPAPTYSMADRVAEGVLVQPAAERAAPATAGRPRVGETTPASSSADGPARPPDLRITPAPPTPSASQTAARIAARVEARLADVLAASATHASPDSLTQLLSHAQSGASDAIWQAQLAAEPALARVLAQIDRLAPRPTMTTPLPALPAPERPPAIDARPAAAGRARDLQVEDGLSVLSGAPASATLFSPTWRQASPVVRAMLSAAGFGPEAGQQAGPAFSFGERLAAVAAHLSARHGLSTESIVAGGLDAPWFSEPTGTLVLPMTGMQAAQHDTRGAAPGQPARATAAANPVMDRAAAASAVMDRAAAASAALMPQVRQPAGLPQALQAALRGAQRRGPAARLRPVPRLTRVDAPIAPDAMAVLTESRATPPAVIGILARAERLLDGGSPISALARAADMPALIALARMVDAPDAVAALSDSRQAPTIMRALAGLAPLATADQAAPLRAQTRWDEGATPPADVFESLDAALVELAAEPRREPVRAQRTSASPTATARKPASPASVAEALTTLTNALPAAVRAALTAASPVSERRSMSQSGAPAARGADLLGAGGRRPSAVDVPGAPTASAPSEGAASRAAQRVASPAPFVMGAIGQTARRAIEWAEMAESAAPVGFEALAIDAGDAAQSPIAQRVLAPRAMRADTIDPTWVAMAGARIDGRPAAGGPAPRGVAGGRTRAAPIGASARRSLAFAHGLDGVGSPPPDAAPRSAWQDAPPWTLIASTAAMPDSAPASTTRAAAARASITPGTVAAPFAPAAGLTRADAALQREAAVQMTAPQRAAMGVPGGRFGWPQATFQWVQAAAASSGAVTPATRFGRQAAASTNAASPASSANAAGMASLRSLALSDRILVRSLEGLGVLGRSSPAATDPLRPDTAATPRLALALALPEAAQASTGAERFADQTFARQAPLTDMGAAPATAASGSAPALDVDWVQPLKAVAAESAQLAPRLRSPGNTRRALDVWVDAVKAEAQRSPAAARRALGSVGQLIGHFSGSSSSAAKATYVRPSKVLRGSLFDGRSPAAVTLEPPTGDDARPTLIRPGEQAARQALRKGTDTVQTSQTTTTEDARHKNSEQTDELLPPEEVERLAAEVIERLKRELEFDAARIGEDGWD